MSLFMPMPSDLARRETPTCDKMTLDCRCMRESLHQNSSTESVGGEHVIEQPGGLNVKQL